MTVADLGAGLRTIAGFLYAAIKSASVPNSASKTSAIAGNSAATSLFVGEGSVRSKSFEDDRLIESAPFHRSVSDALCILRAFEVRLAALFIGRDRLSP